MYRGDTQNLTNRRSSRFCCRRSLFDHRRTWYLLTVVVSAVYLGRGPAILASLAGVLLFDFLFVTPYYTFAVLDTQYIIVFIALFLVGMVISQLTARASEQAEAARQREAETAELYDLSRDLASSANLESILHVFKKHLEQTFSRIIVVLLPEDNRMVAYAISENLKFDNEEMAVADWVYRHAELAGRHTNTLPAAQLRYLPLKTSKGEWACLALASRTPLIQTSPLRNAA